MMTDSTPLQIQLRQLLGDRPVRAFAKQSDADRTALHSQTAGKPLLEISAHSNAGSTPFIDYLYGDILHTLQQPRSNGPDEMTFITMAQVMELMFKLVTHEILRAQDALRRDALDEARLIFARVQRSLEFLAHVWDVLSTITPQGYLDFRDHLGIGSGFESFMYRRMEFLFGNKQPGMLKPHQQVPHLHEMLSQTLHAPSLYDDVIALLHRRGFAIDAAALQRDWSQPYQINDSVRAAWLLVYEKRPPHDDLYRLAEALMELADRFKVWRYRHFVSVERLIGFKPGTGGTSGIGWLKHILDHNFFPELWAIRTEMRRA